MSFFRPAVSIEVMMMVMVVVVVTTMKTGHSRYEWGQAKSLQVEEEKKGLGISTFCMSLVVVVVVVVVVCVWCVWCVFVVGEGAHYKVVSCRRVDCTFFEKT